VKLKLLLAFLLLCLFGYIYLWASYSRIYNTIGDKHLSSPFVSNTFTVGNTNNEGRVTYVALGDSLSAGVGARTIEDTIVYAYAEKLGKKFWQVNVTNLAWPGDDSEDVLKVQLPQALAKEPNYVTLFIGVNDMHNRMPLDEFRSNYKKILDTLLNETRAKIIVINIPYLGGDSLIKFPFTHYYDMKTQQYNSIIASLAQHERIKLVDLYKGSRKVLNQNEDNYADDLFHPSAKGYLLWSTIINAN
jgi:lysophospholipase L1-like esterase